MKQQSRNRKHNERLMVRLGFVRCEDGWRHRALATTDLFITTDNSIPLDASEIIEKVFYSGFDIGTRRLRSNIKTALGIYPAE